MAVTVSHVGEQTGRHVHQFCSFWMREEEERRGKAPRILVEVPFRKEPAVLFLISFIFSN